MGHDRNTNSSNPTCDACGIEMETVLGDSISGLRIYREVTGYRCPNAPHAPETKEQ